MKRASCGDLPDTPTDSSENKPAAEDSLPAKKLVKVKSGSSLGTTSSDERLSDPFSFGGITNDMEDPSAKSPENTKLTKEELYLLQSEKFFSGGYIKKKPELNQSRQTSTEQLLLLNSSCSSSSSSISSLPKPNTTIPRGSAASEEPPPYVQQAREATYHLNPYGSTEGSGTPLDLLLPAPPDDPVLDWEGALEQCGGDEEFLRELLPDLLHEVSLTLERLKKLFANGDFTAKQITQLAHVIKGAAANLVCTLLMKSANTLEIAASAIASANVAAEIVDIAVQKEKLKPFLDQLTTEIESFRKLLGELGILQ